MGGGKARVIRTALVLMAGASLAACATVRPEYATRQPRAHQPSGVGGTYKPYQVGGVWYVPREQPDYDQTGVASWYGDAFNMKATADGEIFDKDLPSAAHTTLPLPCLVEVTNLDNGRKLVVRVNDRGPFVGGRIIDLSHEAARELGYAEAGLAHVRVRYVGPAPLYGAADRRYVRNDLTPPRRAPAAAPPKPKPLPLAPKAAPGGDEVILTAERTPKPPPMVVQTALAPLIGKALPPLGPQAAAAARIASAAGRREPPTRMPSPGGAFRIQAGVFSTPENAQKAVAQLAAAGPAKVAPMERDGAMLYRVVLDGAPDAEAAEALRAKVAEAGFADARIMKLF